MPVPARAPAPATASAPAPAPQRSRPRPSQRVSPASDSDGEGDEEEDEEEDDEDDEDDAAARTVQNERLRLVMAMRRHEFMLDLLEIARMQEMAVMRAQQAEEEQLALALARSLEPQSAHVPERLPPRNDLSQLDKALPAMAFADAKGFLLSPGDDDGDGGKPKHECAVCLGVFEPAEEVRVLPCLHAYHKGCIDKWLARSAACPTCKGEVPLK